MSAMEHPANLLPAAGRGRPSLANDDFEKHRNTITTLYNDEKRPLREVRRLMEDHYGFHASLVAAVSRHKALD